MKKKRKKKLQDQALNQSLATFPDKIPLPHQYKMDPRLMQLTLRKNHLLLELTLFTNNHLSFNQLKFKNREGDHHLGLINCKNRIQRLLKNKKIEMMRKIKIRKNRAKQQFKNLHLVISKCKLSLQKSKRMSKFRKDQDLETILSLSKQKNLKMNNSSLKQKKNRKRKLLKSNQMKIKISKKLKYSNDEKILCCSLTYMSIVLKYLTLQLNIMISTLTKIHITIYF